jgi:hypothetical protein
MAQLLISSSEGRYFNLLTIDPIGSPDALPTADIYL